MQAALPNTKMIGFSYTISFSFFIRAVMLQQGKDYFDQDGKIAIGSKEAIEAAKLMQRFVTEGIAFDTTDWAGTIRAVKSDDIATIPYGIWWGATLKDQAPEMKGKWKLTFLPVLEKGNYKTAHWGGSSGGIINVGDPVKQTAALEFMKNAMLTVENQMLSFKKYNYVPIYLPTYEDTEFLGEDPYFGKDFSEFIFELQKEMPQNAKYTESFPEAILLMESTYQAIINDKLDPEKAMKNAAEQLKNSTGIEISE